ncbi:MAG: DUF2127 domain-containing protein [Anaerolineaceae bacterium]|nr:DUF2127 domain-containing protein [Anaerolineaceae bacterium]
MNNSNNSLDRQRKLICSAAILQSIYTAIEISDCIAVLLMALGVIGNFYPKLLFAEMQHMFDNDPVWLIPLFLFYTSLRAVSAVGLWKNRLWGFWLTIFISTATLIMAPFMLPFTTAEMLLNGILVIVLMIGFLGNRPIIQTHQSNESI